MDAPVRNKHTRYVDHNSQLQVKKKYTRYPRQLNQTLNNLHNLTKKYKEKKRKKNLDSADRRQYRSSSLEYCVSMCDPYTKKKKNRDKIENVQREASGFDTNNYSKLPGTVTAIKSDLKWIFLENRRQTSSLT